jgi:hypothetical protein
MTEQENSGGEYPGRDAYDKVEAKANEMRGLAWGEALEINKKYDELYSRKDQIDQEIADFRRKKLGMGEEREEEKNSKRSKKNRLYQIRDPPSTYVVILLGASDGF